MWAPEIEIIGANEKSTSHNEIKFIALEILQQFFIRGATSHSVLCLKTTVQLPIDLSPTSGHVAPHVDFLTSFYYDVTMAQLFDGPFDCDVTMKKSTNRCDVGPLAKGQLK